MKVSESLHAVWSLAALAGFFLILHAGAGQASEAAAGLGDWGGERAQLAEEGLSFQLALTAEGAANLTGGSRHALQQAGQIKIGATADLDKMFSISNAKLQLAITKREGGNLDSEAGLPVLMQVQEIFGRGNIWRLSEFSYDQTYFSDALDFKIGWITPGSDFAAFACDFQNLTFCGASPGNLVGNYWMNSPVGQWGTRLKLNFAKTIYAEAAAYQVKPENATTGFALGPHGGTGVLLPVEIAWLPAVRLPGSYKLGGWYSTTDEADLFFDINGQPQVITGALPLEREGSSGAYLNFQQQVTGDPSDPAARGLTLFLNAVAADRRTTHTDRQFVIGATYAGLIDARPQDAVALAFGINHVSGRVAAAQELSNDAGLTAQPIQKSEYVTELDYRLHATGWLNVDPNLQYIRHPGGYENFHDALVVGLKLAVTL